jgi:hypothetical protein
MFPEHFAYDFSVLISDCNASYNPSAAEHKLPFGRGLSRVSLFEVVSFLARPELDEYRREARVDEKLRSLVTLYLLP